MRFHSGASSRVIEFLAALVLASAGTVPAWATEVHHFDIPEEEAAVAIRDFGAQAHAQILVAGEAVRNKRLHAVSGDLSTEAAINTLLDGSGLTHRYVGDSSIALLPVGSVTNTSSAITGQPSDNGTGVPNSSGPFLLAQSAAMQTQGASSVDLPNDQATQENKKKGELQVVVVTGTHIHGEREVAAPTTIITRDDIARAGFSTLPDVMNSASQNLSDVSYAGQFAAGASALANENTDGAQGVNLYGLGPEATLVLLDGQRRPGENFGRVFDVSAIPLPIVDHVDIVTGGASAIYGSDAVAGVVNIITRKDFDGAQTDASYGFRDGSGGQRLQLSQLVGMTFDNGGVLLAYQYEEDSALDATAAGLATQNPNVSSPIPGVFDLIPETIRQSGFASGHYQLDRGVELYGDALVSSRNSNSFEDSIFGGGVSATQNGLRDLQSSLVLGALVNVSAWKLDVTADAGEADIHYPSEFSFTAPGFTFSQLSEYRNRSTLSSLSAVADGPLMTIAGVTPKAALGAEVERDTVRFSTSSAGAVASLQDSGRDIRSLFAEVSVPFVQEGTRAAPRRLELSLSGRFDDYSDFGHTFNPQAGLVWEPAGGLAVRGSYSRAFRAPDLFTLTRAGDDLIESLPNLASPPGTTPVLIREGGNPDLGPETADTWTAGVDFAPVFAPWSKLSLSYFDVRYKERLAIPASNELSILQDASFYPGLLNTAPSAAALAAALAAEPNAIFNQTGTPFDPQTQNILSVFPDIVLFDNRFNNIAVQSFRSLDLQYAAKLEAGSGHLLLSANGTYIFDNRQQITATAPALSVLNTPGNIVNLRLRGSVGWEQAGFGAFAFMNFVNHYDNPYTVPASQISSWTTFDLSVRYDGSATHSGGIFDGLVAAVSAQNLFDRPPPYFANPVWGITYDTVNASPLGRFVSLRISKKFGGAQH